MKIKLNIWLTLSLFVINSLLILLVFNILYISLQNELISRTHDQLKSVNILKRRLLDQFLLDKYEEANHIIEYYITHTTKETELEERLEAINDVIEVRIYADKEVDPHKEKTFNAEYKGMVSHFNFYFRFQGQVVEILFGFNSIENILQERTGLGATGESYLVSNDRRLITSSYFYPEKKPFEIISNTTGVNRALNDIEGVENYADYRDVRIMGSFRVLEFYGIKAALLTEIDHSEVMEPIDKIRQEVMLLLGFLLVFLLIISAGFAQVLSRPIFRLKEVAKLLSRGELPSKLPSPSFIYEIAEITFSVNQLIQSMKQTVTFAEEIGRGRMDESYRPLSEKDELGLAILQMRDQLVKLDAEKNILELQAKRILIETQENERERIARDLHDGLGTMLTTMRMKMENSGLLNEKGRELRELLDKTINETRTLARSLMPAVLMDFGLNAALSQLVKDIMVTSGIPVIFVNELESSGKQLDKNKRVGIYRIAQEALNNALKHSKCSEVTVSITEFDDHLVLFIKDNGLGFSTETVVEGLGLRNMEERSRAMNGTLILESDKEGTSVEVLIPL